MWNHVRSDGHKSNGVEVMAIWYRWISDYHSGKWYESSYQTKEEEQDSMRNYMDPLQFPMGSRMYEITDIEPPEEEISRYRNREQ
jgi:hypothetical protein